MSFILGSKSPRRQELLRQIYRGEFLVLPADIDEKSVDSADFLSLPLAIARVKLDKLRLDHPQDSILTSDTMVYDGEKRLGKPADRAEARDMLLELAGREHLVITGYCLFHNGSNYEGLVTSRVYIPLFDDERLDAYLATGSSLDKAGAYGIQDELVQAQLIEGSYYNVMGFPREALVQLFERLNLK